MKRFSEYYEDKMPVRIPRNDPVRNAVAALPTYWDSPGEAITEIARILDEHGYAIEEVISFNDNLPKYKTTYNLRTKAEKPFEVGKEVENAMLVFSWYKMPSMRYEITTYIS